MKYGILTLYHDNTNYGANLQAYALCAICKKHGFNAEQIDYYNGKRIRQVLSLIYRFVFKKRYYKNNEFYTRKMAIKRFRDSIPHSKTYYRENLKKANNNYTGFIVGSDQVWNPEWITDAFALRFADAKRLRMSYAASIGRISLSNKEKELFASILSQMDYISVREKNGVELLSKTTDKKIEWVLDPTLLLSEAEWNLIASPRKISERYIFCYFLNDYLPHRDFANQYARSQGIKIATFPYLSYQMRKSDDGFGDYQIYDASPSDFISLIKYADYVFTDSFHATVFCHLYHKEFVVFSQAGKESRVRMDSLTEMFGTSERHLVGDELLRLETIAGFSPIDHPENSALFLKMKAKSIEFLVKSLSSEEADNG